MKKIFTLAAAVLFTAGMFAAYTPTDDEVIYLKADAHDENATDAGFSKHAAIAWAANPSWSNKKAGDPENDGASTASSVQTCSVKGNGGAKNMTINISGCSKIIIYHEALGDNVKLYMRDGNKSGEILFSNDTKGSFFTEATLDPETEYTFFMHGYKTSDQDVYLYAIKLIPGTVVPVTDPVTSVVIEGSDAVYTNHKATYSATTDVKANAYKWFVNGAEQEGATSKSFEFTPDAVGTYAISCSAKNDNNTDFVASNVINLVVTEREIVEQVSISEATTWDWTKAASVSTIQWTADSEPYKKNVDTVVMANIEGMNNNDAFNSQALLFNGEYPVRSGQYAQGNMISFTTTVPGYVKVDFSNTGTKDVARYVAVNGVVNTTVGTLNQDRVSSAYIPVAAGEVKIEGSFENYSDGVQYLHFFQIVFGTGDVPTAINNAEEAVKTVKVIRNGQLFIEKNGVLYNAQGAVVK